jgi:hypothetical protein
VGQLRVRLDSARHRGSVDDDRDCTDRDLAATSLMELLEILPAVAAHAAQFGATLADATGIAVHLGNRTDQNERLVDADGNPI